MQIGFVGLGIMGHPMAAHLTAGGHHLNVFGGPPVPQDIRDKATACATIKEVAEKSEVVILMVPDTPDVEAVLFGPRGVAEGLHKGTLGIAMCSIRPVATKTVAQ